MTDDIVKRLREYAIHMDAWGQEANHDADIVEEAADRIEQLEAANLKASLIKVDDMARIEQLEAELHHCFHRIEELQAALRSIIVHCEVPAPPNAEALKMFARTALEGKNE